MSELTASATEHNDPITMHLFSILPFLLTSIYRSKWAGEVFDRVYHVRVSFNKGLYQMYCPTTN